MSVTDKEAKAFWDRGLKSMEAAVKAEELFYRYVLYEALVIGMHCLLAEKKILEGNSPMADPEGLLNYEHGYDPYWGNE